MRPATQQTNDLTEQLLSMPQDAQYQQLRNMIHDCSNTHFQLAKEASMGTLLYLYATIY